jgi:hypothetical protein
LRPPPPKGRLEQAILPRTRLSRRSGSDVPRSHQTAHSRALVDAVARRADAGSCSFTLLVPASSRGLHRVIDPHGMAEAERRLEAAIPLLTEAAGSEVVGLVGAHEPFAAVQDALDLFGFDEVIGVENDAIGLPTSMQHVPAA